MEYFGVRRITEIVPGDGERKGPFRRLHLLSQVFLFGRQVPGVGGDALSTSPMATNYRLFEIGRLAYFASLCSVAPTSALFLLNSKMGPNSPAKPLA